VGKNEKPRREGRGVERRAKADAGRRMEVRALLDPRIRPRHLDRVPSGGGIKVWALERGRQNHGCEFRDGGAVSQEWKGPVRWKAQSGTELLLRPAMVWTFCPVSRLWRPAYCSSAVGP
jgi:hypothetical protein